jgi:hypothetical protein
MVLRTIRKTHKQLPHPRLIIHLSLDLEEHKMISGKTHIYRARIKKQQRHTDVMELKENEMTRKGNTQARRRQQDHGASY